MKKISNRVFRLYNVVFNGLKIEIRLIDNWFNWNKFIIYYDYYYVDIILS